MSTIREVAARAGVSIATVSRVANGSGYVSPGLRARVETAMRDLDYLPSGLARGLRTRRSSTVAVMIPQLNHPFFGTLAYAIERTLFGHGYRCFVCSSEEDRAKEAAYLAQLLEAQVDGVALVPTGLDPAAVRRLRERDVPLVLLDRDLPDAAVDRVLVDNEGGGHAAARHLLGLGHRAVGVIGAPAHSPALRARLRGFERAFAEAGVARDAALVVTEEGEQFGAGYRGARRLLARSEPPTAIAALTDVIAVGALHAAAGLGVAVPAELSVTGFDDIPLASQVIPELTTVAQPLAAMGERAAGLLLARMRGDGGEPRAVTLATELVVRGSSAAPARATSAAEGAR